jgi:hypothetical protein
LQLHFSCVPNHESKQIITKQILKMNNSNTNKAEQLNETAVIGSLLSPSWNNEACNTCKENHKYGRIKKLCSVLYNGKCFIEQVNILRNEHEVGLYLHSEIFDLVRKHFPELKIKNNIGTTRFYAYEFDKTFLIHKGYGDVYQLGFGFYDGFEF